jgi:hypothetical protein
MIALTNSYMKSLLMGSERNSVSYVLFFGDGLQVKMASSLCHFNVRSIMNKER